MKFLSIVDKAPFLARLFISLVLGIGLAYTQSPHHLWILIFPCFGIFYYLYAKADTKKQVFLLSYIFALGYFIAGLNWIGNALLVEGNEFWWVWPIAVIALPMLLSAFTALFATISHILFDKTRFFGFIGFCALIMLAEWSRGYAFTGFPWNLYGYTWISVMPVAQSASAIGPYGLSLLTLFWGAGVGFYLLKPSRLYVPVMIIISFIMVYNFGYFRLSKNEHKLDNAVQFIITQPNIEQADKWNAQKLVENFEKQIEVSKISQRTQKNIIVWPETALPPPLINDPAAQERVRTLLDANTILLAGGLQITHDAVTKTPLYHNSLLVWDNSGKIDSVYSKSHLVPLGEYIPFQKYIPIRPVARFSGFSMGGGPTTVFHEGFPSFSPQICYEIIFPHQAINRKMDRPDYILTITNDAWYGDSAGPRQHFTQARFRAIENGLPVIRSANTGISGVVGPYGEVLQMADLLTTGQVISPLPLKIEDTYYGMFGDTIFLIISALCLLCAALFSRKYLRNT